MIQTAAIIWAVLATGLGIRAGIGWRRCEDRAFLMNEKLGRFTTRTKEAERLMWAWQGRANTAETHINAIHLRRHEAAKKARAAQLAQRAALVAAKAEQIRKEIGR